MRLEERRNKKFYLSCSVLKQEENANINLSSFFIRSIVKIKNPPFCGCRVAWGDKSELSLYQPSAVTAQTQERNILLLASHIYISFTDVQSYSTAPFRGEKHEVFFKIWKDFRSLWSLKKIFNIILIVRTNDPFLLFLSIVLNEALKSKKHDSQWRRPRTLPDAYESHHSNFSCDACVSCRANFVIKGIIWWQLRMEKNTKRRSNIKNVKDWKIFRQRFLFYALRFALFELFHIYFSILPFGLWWDMCVRFYSLFTRFNFLLCLCVESCRWKSALLSFSGGFSFFIFPRSAQRCVWVV